MRRLEVVLAVLATVWLAGCGGGPTIEVEPTDLVLTPDDDVFNAGGQRVKVSFQRGGLIVGQPPSVLRPSWLFVGFDGSDDGGSFFRFTANAAFVPPGDQGTTVRFMTSEEDGSDGPFADVHVTYRSTANAPFTFSPARLEFTAKSGQLELPAAASTQVSTSSGQVTSFSTSVSYDFASQEGWLDVLQGQTGSTPAVLTLRPKTTVLTPGKHWAYVDVTATSWGMRFPVLYTVQDPESLSVSPSQLEFTAVSGASNSFQHKLLTVNTGNGRIGYSLATSYTGTQKSWLTLYPGGLSQTIDVQVNTTTLPPGQYQAVVIITLASAEGDVRKRIPILYTVTAQ